MNDSTKIYSFLEKANLAAFDSADYDKAYHLLASLLHFAQSMRNSGKLKEISETALIQSERIDLLCPDYHHSTANSALRGHGNIFVSLSTQAKTASKIILTNRMAVKEQPRNGT